MTKPIALKPGHRVRFFTKNCDFRYDHGTVDHIELRNNMELVHVKWDDLPEQPILQFRENVIKLPDKR